MEVVSQNLMNMEVERITKVLDNLVAGGRLDSWVVKHWGDYRGWYVDAVLPNGKGYDIHLPGSWGHDGNVHIESTGHWTKADALVGILRVLPPMNPYLENNGGTYVTCPEYVCEAGTVRAEYLSEHLAMEHGWA